MGTELMKMQPMLRRLAVLLLLVCTAAAAQAAPKIERFATPAGIEVWLVREPSIPMIALQAAWRGGSSVEPDGQEGLAAMAMGLLTEGAGGLDSDAFQNAMRETAVSLDFSADRDYLTASLRSLTEHRERAFELLKLALTAPRFDPEPLARAKAQALVSWQRGRSNPNTLAGERFAQLAYGSHPYGRRTTASAESLERIDREALAVVRRP